MISGYLSLEQETSLLSTLRKYKGAIGLSMADIKGISPFIVQHHIHLIDDAKPTRYPQRKLNPIMKDVARDEILKLLDNGIIYSIFDSSWVSPILLVPKKSGITIIKMRQMNSSQPV